jgi:hypothetical protein
MAHPGPGNRFALVTVQILAKRRLITRRKTSYFQQNALVYVGNCWQSSANLVKWTNGYKQEITQHELENSVPHLLAGGDFSRCIGRCGGDNYHADSACGCAASPTRSNRANFFPGRERDPRIARSTNDRR